LLPLNKTCWLQGEGLVSALKRNPEKFLERLVRWSEDDGRDFALRADRIEALHALRAVPLISNVLGPLLVWSTLGGAERASLSIWLIGFFVLVIVDLLDGPSLRGDRPADMKQVARDERRAVITCFGFGVMWGLLATLHYESASAEQRHLITLVLTGYLASAPLVLAAVPAAVFAFALPILIQVTPVLIADGVMKNSFLLQLIAVYSVVVTITLRHYWAAFAERTQALGEVGEQKHLIGVLLDDFRSSSSEWLWHTDENLRFQRIAKRFRKEGPSVRDPMIDLDPDTALGAIFTSNGIPDAGACRAVEAMKAGEPFRNVILRVVTDGEERWWSVSGTPGRDRDGRFVGYRGVGRDITEKCRAEQELTFLAHHDALTGAANRASFNQQLHNTGLAVAGSNLRFALIQFDLDDFKAVNDTAGHAAGDEVLCVAYQRMIEHMPPGAFLARIGGDEFAAILQLQHTTQPEEVLQLADAMVSAVSRPIEAAGGVFRIGASAGIALMPDNGRDPHAVLQLADIALYNAKSDSVARVHLASARDGEAYSYRKVLERDLRSAVERGEFRLNFQPIVDALTGRAVVMEALLRWKHPIFGNISPGEFIPIAEQTGSIQQIGQWALREACKTAATWPETVRVAVNISPRQLDRDDLGAMVLSAVKEAGLKPNRLELEITESAFLGGAERVRKVVKRMQAYGVKVAMDDFGTGYSSLSSLQDVPFDKLKIDRSLVSRDRREERAVSILRSIIAIGKALDMHVTAEGVETAEQAAFLKGLGCHSLQGFLFARPMPTSDLPVFFAREARRMLEDASMPAPARPASEGQVAENL
jgi:diguanylate cyclase (GGDEF)-like protein